MCTTFPAARVVHELLRVKILQGVNVVEEERYSDVLTQSGSIASELVLDLSVDTIEPNENAPNHTSCLLRRIGCRSLRFDDCTGARPCRARILSIARKQSP
jgi:hypothetical protein